MTAWIFVAIIAGVTGCIISITICFKCLVPCVSTTDAFKTFFQAFELRLYLSRHLCVCVCVCVCVSGTWQSHEVSVESPVRGSVLPRGKRPEKDEAKDDSLCCLSAVCLYFIDWNKDGSLYSIDWEEGPEERCTFHPTNECWPVSVMLCLVCDEVYRGWGHHLCPQCHCD